MVNQDQPTKAQLTQLAVDRLQESVPLPAGSVLERSTDVRLRNDPYSGLVWLSATSMPWRQAVVLWSKLLDRFPESGLVPVLVEDRMDIHSVVRIVSPTDPGVQTAKTDDDARVALNSYVDLYPGRFTMRRLAQPGDLTNALVWSPSEMSLDRALALVRVPHTWDVATEIGPYPITGDSEGVVASWLRRFDGVFLTTAGRDVDILVGRRPANLEEAKVLFNEFTVYGAWIDGVDEPKDLLTASRWSLVW